MATEEVVQVTIRSHPLEDCGFSSQAFEDRSMQSLLAKVPVRIRDCAQLISFMVKKTIKLEKGQEVDPNPPSENMIKMDKVVEMTFFLTYEDFCKFTSELSWLAATGEVAGFYFGTV
jgi:hypothetical protein